MARPPRHRSARSAGVQRSLKRVRVIFFLTGVDWVGGHRGEGGRWQQGAVEDAGAESEQGWTRGRRRSRRWSRRRCRRSRRGGRDAGLRRGRRSRGDGGAGLTAGGCGSQLPGPPRSRGTRRHHPGKLRRHRQDRHLDRQDHTGPTPHQRGTGDNRPECQVVAGRLKRQLGTSPRSRRDPRPGRRCSPAHSCPS
jgi:hypothetical protein